MADPMTIGMLGAGVGAMMDKEQPLRGAALGGAMGFGGGHMMGVGASGATSAGAGATNNALYGALPGMAPQTPQAAMLAEQTAGFLPTQAEMLAAQTAEFGTPGLLATGDAMNAPGMAGKLYQGGNNLVFGGQDASKMMQAGQAIGGMGQQEQQPRPMTQPIAAAPMNRPQPLPFNSPYERQPQNYTYGQPSLLPGFRG